MSTIGHYKSKLLPRFLVEITQGFARGTRIVSSAATSKFMKLTTKEALVNTIVAVEVVPQNPFNHKSSLKNNGKLDKRGGDDGVKGDICIVKYKNHLKKRERSGKIDYILSKREKNDE
ncbi:unnamed protein product [Lepeophtheirus salmonis]|uniref:(salmon louse) hypothetical protein n=1 Tax=Lepeophtheirus salmonis TaxID=72036 RepID=A0A7R8D4U4_LEPSM|nr:unnamed protein product [Lepeophtheirus salmonis]CAF2999154.1 unnamed protein product [Lepeophtheirus salmonis]